jgi:hypothetical protein
MPTFSQAVTPATMSTILGCAENELPAFCVERIKKAKLAYNLLERSARDAHILKILTRLENDPGIKRSTDQNIEAFEQGWRENYNLCKAQGVTRAHLKPKYVRPYDCIKFLSDFIAPENPFILDELLWIAVNYSFHRYLGDYSHVYEFGCGTGQYLFDLAQMYPDKQLVGTDWTKASGDILGLMADSGMKIKGVRFDMLKPDHSFKLEPGAAVVTIGALEQIGPNFKAFLAYILQQKPGLVIHHEPIEDFYNPDCLVDYLGIYWHKRRGYLQGYVPALRELEQQGVIEIIDAHRIAFGDPFHESASRIVWRPVAR